MAKICTKGYSEQNSYNILDKCYYCGSESLYSEADLFASEKLAYTYNDEEKIVVNVYAKCPACHKNTRAFHVPPVVQDRLPVVKFQKSQKKKKRLFFF